MMGWQPVARVLTSAPCSARRTGHTGAGGLWPLFVIHHGYRKLVGAGSPSSNITADNLRNLTPLPKG